MAELLVVIVIISLLAGLVFPSLSKARESARRTACRNNLLRIGQGFLLYSQDYDDNYPSVASDSSSSRPLASLAMLYDGYVSAREVFTCPSTQDRCDKLTPGDTFRPHASFDSGSGSGSDRMECSYGYDDLKDRTTDPDVAVMADAPDVTGEEAKATGSTDQGKERGGKEIGRASCRERV